MISSSGQLPALLVNHRLRVYMFIFPETEKKLKARISSYRTALNKEKKTHHFINDGSGKRYVLFSLYFLLNDLNKSERFFNWYQEEFPDDAGEPIQQLCWSLSLLRMNKPVEARYRLAKLMLDNLYLIPYVMGQPLSRNTISGMHPTSRIWIILMTCQKRSVTPSRMTSGIGWLRRMAHWSFAVSENGTSKFTMSC